MTTVVVILLGDLLSLVLLAGFLAPKSDIGTAMVGGTASHVPASWGDSYLALPEHKWGQRGLLVTVCGEGCVTRRSTDAGPDLAMQRQGRVVDLSWADFRHVCGVAEGEPNPGLCEVTVEYLAEIVLPETDTEGSAVSEPTTQAGRALAEDYPGLGGMEYGMTGEPIIAAIEAEARALLLDELEVAVRGLEHPPKWFPFSQSDILDRSDVLALIQQHREAIR
jgi:hypothetical protein